MATIAFSTMRHMLARRLGDHAAGTATGGSTTTLLDATRRKEKNDYWAGAWCKVYAGTGLGQERPLSASTQATGTLTHAATAWTAPDATSLYELHRIFSAAEYDEFLKESQRWHTRNRRLVSWTLDTSLTWVTDQWDYTIPATIVGIQQVELSTETGAPDSDEYEFIERDRWSVRRSATRKLVFHKKFGQPASGTLIRITGIIEFTDATLDADTFNLDANPIVALALAHATLGLIGAFPASHYDRLHQRAVEEHERLLARVPEPMPSDVVWVEAL